MDAFKKITEGMTGQEVAGIIYQNDTNSLTDYIVSYLHPTEGINGTNIYTLTMAISKIPQDIRKQGMVCTFLSQGGWESYKNIGTSIDDWNITDNWILIATKKELSNLATQNGFMQCANPDNKVEVNFNTNATEITISFPSGLYVSYGNNRIINAATENGTVITSTSADSLAKYLVYNLATNSFGIVKYDNQMKNCILLGWIYFGASIRSCTLLCDKYSIDGNMVSNQSLSDISYANIPTTVIQLKKYADDGYILIQLVSSIDTEVKITGGYASFNAVDFTETSIGIKKETLTKLYFKCVESYAIIEAKGVYRIIVGSDLSNYYVSQSINDFGDSLTQLASNYDNGIFGEIKDFNRNMTYISIGGGNLSRPNISGEFKDLPRLLTYLHLASGGISINGDVVDLPRKLNHLYLNTSLRPIGNPADLPKGLTYLSLYNLNEEFNGDIANFPPSLTTILLFGAYFNISGNIKNAPSNITNMQIGGMSTLSGSIADIPRKISTLALYNSSDIYGNLSDLPPTLSAFSIRANTEEILGDIGDVPNKTVTSLKLVGKINITFNKEFPLSSSFISFVFNPNDQFPIDSATVDKILIALDGKAISTTGTKNIDLIGACAAPTEASQAATASLQQKGFTVQTN